MGTEFPIAIRVTKEAKNTTIENCEFRDCGVENSGENTNLIQNRFKATREWVKSKPTWLKLTLFLITTISAAFIVRAIEKIWV